jgi:hypothetical protein
VCLCSYKAVQSLMLLYAWHIPKADTPLCGETVFCIQSPTNIYILRILKMTRVKSLDTLKTLKFSDDLRFLQLRL